MCNAVTPNVKLAKQLAMALPPSERIGPYARPKRYRCTRPMTYALPNELVGCPGCGAAVRHIDYVPAARPTIHNPWVHRTKSYALNENVHLGGYTRRFITTSIAKVVH